MYQVLAFDPGGATGWAHALKDGDEWIISSGTQWDKEHHAWIRFMIEKRRYITPLTVVTESFEFRNASGQNNRRGLDLVSREYIGVMKLVCLDYEIPLVQQMPAHALVFMSDKKLEKVGHLRTPLHDCRHENDALRHLFKYLITTKKEPYWRNMLKKDNNALHSNY